jgi:predicted nucleotidyltransferase
MPEVVTIAERKSREAARRRAAAANVILELKRYADEHRGRFLVFGSVAEDRIGPDSDFDVIVDFPADAENPAVESVEEICSRYRIPADVHAMSVTRAAFFDRISGRTLVIA